MGLLVQGLRAMDYSGFGLGDATRVAARLADRPRQRAEIQACAPCHARRGPITDVPDYGRTFLDSYRPAVLTDGLYYADGQILEEVYEYASFTQSKMYRAGVTCSDCHNAHSLKQRGTGNNVCLHCHLPLNYDTPDHHHHKPGTDAALCRNCHMRDDDLHGGGSPLRPLDARAPGGLLDHVRDSQRLHHAVPRGQEPEVGERRGGEVVRPDADARQRLRGGAHRRRARVARTPSASCAPRCSTRSFRRSPARRRSRPWGRC